MAISYTDARTEIGRANASLGKPFPQATDLTAARERARQIDKQLQAAAQPARNPPPDRQRTSRHQQARRHE